MRTNNRKLLYNMCLIGILSALSYVGVLIQIPIPSFLGKPMIHLGNLVVIISALIFGGSVGGISGSIGMGIYDIINGYDLFSIIRTILLKLIMGLIVGHIYQIKLKNSSKKSWILYITGGFITLLGLIFMIMAIITNGEVNIELISKTMIISWPVYVFSLIIGIFLLIIAIFSNKLTPKLKCACIASSIAICVNIFGEFVYKLLKQMILGGSDFVASVYLSFTSIPSTLINGGITLTIVLLIFMPIELVITKNR